jgi:hypothetical protein
VFKADPGVVDEHGLLADAQRRLQVGACRVDRVAAQPQDARRVEDVERAISSMFAVVDRLHLLTSAQINVLVSADREAAIPAMQGQVLIDLREHGGRLASNVMAPVAVPGPGGTNRCARHCRPRAACWSCGGWRQPRVGVPQ